MENKKIVLTDEEVVLLDNTESAFRSNFSLPRTFRVDDLKAKFVHRSSKISIFDWVEVEVMRIGKGEWQKGKMRIECVFVLDEEENSRNLEDNLLDELRTNISEFDE